MSSSMNYQQDGMFMVTQMYPTSPQGEVVWHRIPQQTGTSSFLRAHPLALGTVQIMIGLLVLSFGLVSLFADGSHAVITGFFVWGAGIYITAGSLTVAAGKSSNRCLMNTTLAFNVIATIAACGAVIFYAFDAVSIEYCEHYNSFECYSSETYRLGLSSILAVFNFLEFIITIVVSAFACKTTCNCCKKGLPTYPAASTSMAHPPPQMMNFSHPANGQDFFLD